MKKIARAVFIILVMALLWSLTGCGTSTKSKDNSQDYPKKPIVIISPYASGGVNDMIARIFAASVEKQFGQGVAVVNKAGGGGAVGGQEAALAKPDGYTILNGANGPLTIAPYTANAGYTYENCKPVANLVTINFALAVPADSQFNSLKELIDAMKKNPGKISVGTPGAGTIQQLAFTDFALKQGIKFTHMPFEGANPAISALIGKHLDVSFTGTPEVISAYKAKQLRILGVPTAERLKQFPDVPTFKEQGYNFISGAWTGPVVPKNTPDAIVAKLAAAFKKALEDPEVVKKLENLNLTPFYEDPQKYNEHIKSEAETNKKVLKELGLIK